MRGNVVRNKTEAWSPGTEHGCQRFEEIPGQELFARRMGARDAAQVILQKGLILTPIPWSAAGLVGWRPAGPEGPARTRGSAPGAALQAGVGCRNTANKIGCATML